MVQSQGEKRASWNNSPGSALHNNELVLVLVGLESLMPTTMADGTLAF